MIYHCNHCIADELAAMASDSEITYTPTYRTRKVGRSVWHEMTAQPGNYTYWLAREHGSYKGSHMKHPSQH